MPALASHAVTEVHFFTVTEVARDVVEGEGHREEKETSSPGGGRGADKAHSYNGGAMTGQPAVPMGVGSTWDPPGKSGIFAPSGGERGRGYIVGVLI